MLDDVTMNDLFDDIIHDDRAIGLFLYMNTIGYLIA